MLYFLSCCTFILLVMLVFYDCYAKVFIVTCSNMEEDNIVGNVLDDEGSLKKEKTSSDTFQAAFESNNELLKQVVVDFSAIHHEMSQIANKMDYLTNRVNNLENIMKQHSTSDCVSDMDICMSSPQSPQSNVPITPPTHILRM